MGLIRNLRVLYKAHVKEIRDKKAGDAYVRDEGIAIGKAEDVLRLLTEHESISGELEQVILAERDINTLNRWLKLAAKAENVGEFREKAGL